ncbi:hypothetical protein KPATCC21470_5841 [Kitasatospora purpeofusca]
MGREHARSRTGSGPAESPAGLCRVWPYPVPGRAMRCRVPGRYPPRVVGRRAFSRPEVPASPLPGRARRSDRTPPPAPAPSWRPPDGGPVPAPRRAPRPTAPSPVPGRAPVRPARGGGARAQGPRGQRRRPATGHARRASGARPVHRDRVLPAGAADPWSRPGRTVRRVGGRGRLPPEAAPGRGQDTVRGSRARHRQPRAEPTRPL